MGITSDELKDNTTVAKVNAILENLGGSSAELPDNLMSTKLKAIIDNTANGGGGGGMEELSFTASNGTNLYQNKLTFNQDISKYSKLVIVYEVTSGSGAVGFVGDALAQTLLEHSFEVLNTDGNKFDGWYGNVFYVFSWMTINHTDNSLTFRGYQMQWVTNLRIKAVYGI